MKRVLFILFLCLSSFSFAQMTGDLPTSGRKLLTPYSFKGEGTTAGVVVLDIAVNVDGKVTSTVVIPEESTIVSIPTLMKIKNEVRLLKFESGLQFPAYHHAKFTINVRKTGS